MKPSQLLLSAPISAFKSPVRGVTSFPVSRVHCRWSSSLLRYGIIGQSVALHDNPLDVLTPGGKFGADDCSPVDE